MQLNRHIPSLDGLRGLAVLLVVFYHVFPHRSTGILGLISSASWWGVDLFFVLSGFLITGILYDNQGSPAYFRSFYARRALRLLPIYVLFVIVVCIYPHKPTGHAWWVTVVYLCYGANLVLFSIPTFQFGMPLIVNHIWSLSVEEQFYLLWPWIVARVSTPQRLLLTCAGGSIATLGLRLYISHLHLEHNLFIYYELPTHADALLFGAAASLLYRNPGFITRHLYLIRLVAISAPITYLAMAIRVHTFFFATAPINTWGYTLLATTGMTVLLLAVTPGSLTSKVLANSFFRFYGRYSYGLYLIHQAPGQYDLTYVAPLFNRYISPLLLAAILHFAVILGVYTAIAVLVFHLVEQPFLHLKRHFPEVP